MNPRRPPALAVWLLKRLGLAARNEPLAGDLLEEFRSGRTTAWYWRQTLMAIAAEFGQRLHFYWLDLLSLFAGCAAETCALLVLWILHTPFGFRGFGLALAMLSAVWIAMYVEYRIRLQVWRNDFDSSEEESDASYVRNISPRFGALLVFGSALAFDGATALLMRLPWPEFAHLALLPVLLVLNVFMFFCLAGVLVSRVPTGSSCGNTSRQELDSLWRRIHSLGDTAFFMGLVLMFRSDNVLKVGFPWLDVVLPILALVVIVGIFQVFAYVVARALSDLSAAAQPPGDKV